MTPIKIMVAGVGGAGSKIVDRAAAALDDSVAVAAINTDARALQQAQAAIKLQIGSARTEGFGAGGDANLGRLSAEDEKELIRAMFADVRLAIVVAGLGGGTGSGATPVVLAAAREVGATTLCFATLPFPFEGAQRNAQAERALLSLRDACDAVIVVPNERLFESVGDAGVTETFARADEVLGNGIRAICKLITQPGYVNLDFADLQQVIHRGGGVCTFGYGDGRGDGRAGKAAAELLDGSLLRQGQTIEEARCVLVSILGGPDLTIREISEVMNAVSSKLPKTCHVTMGTVVEDEWQGRVTVTMVASERLAPEPDARPPEEAPAEPVVTGESPARGKKKAAAQQQTKLKLEASGKGRFRDVEPTVLDGEDLDVPTFIRRNIPIER